MSHLFINTVTARSVLKKKELVVRQVNHLPIVPPSRTASSFFFVFWGGQCRRFASRNARTHSTDDDHD